MKSEEIQADIERLQEKAYQAEQLEQLHEWAVQAEGLITDVLCHPDLTELGIEPNSWLISYIYDLVKEIESKLEWI